MEQSAYNPVLRAVNQCISLESEKHYYQQHQRYYQNIRQLGLEYPALDYDKALPFLLMLPACL